jgi:hypothetical protein
MGSLEGSAPIRLLLLPPPLHMLRMLVETAAAAAAVVVIGIDVVGGIDGDSINAFGSATMPGRTTGCPFVCASSCARRRAQAAYTFFCDASTFFCCTGDDVVVVVVVVVAVVVAVVVFAAVSPLASVAVAAAFVCCEHTLHFASSDCGVVADTPSSVRRVWLSAVQWRMRALMNQFDT